MTLDSSRHRARALHAVECEAITESVEFAVEATAARIVALDLVALLCGGERDDVDATAAASFEVFTFLACALCASVLVSRHSTVAIQAMLAVSVAVQTGPATQVVPVNITTSELPRLPHRGLPVCDNNWIRSNC